MRKKLDATVFIIMVFVCAIWGLQQVALKIAEPYISPVLQLSIRSGLAALIIFIIFNRRDGIVNYLKSPRVSIAGLFVGLMFSLEFLMVASGLKKTTTGHITLFLYTAPLFTAIGLHFLIKEERMTRVQWAGITLAFVGIAVAVQFSWSYGAVLSGDLFALTAGLCWGLSSIIIRVSSLSTIPPSCTLFYQLAITSIALALSAFFTENNSFVLCDISILSLVFQTIIVSVISYLLWFTLLRYYKVSSLGSLILMTPIMGIAAGSALLGETVQPNFIMGSVLIIAGLILTRFGQTMKPVR
ncbi:DMT family transporter [Mixta tenebrionis]|nr:DMT family transporter [Mixta tenebrionis]